MVSASSKRASFVAPGTAANTSWSARANRQAASALATPPAVVRRRAIAVRQAASAPCAAGLESANWASRASDRRYIAIPSSRFPVKSSREATAVRLRPTSAFTPASAPAAFARSCRSASTAWCAARAASALPTCFVKSASSKFDCASARLEAKSDSLPSSELSLP